MEEIVFNVCVIDYIGKLETGIAVIMSLNVDDRCYELIYWFNVSDFDDVRIVIDDDFLIDFNIPNIYDYEKFDELVRYIESVLPSKPDMIKTFS